MANHTSWRVGGPARWFYEPRDIADLTHFLAQVPAEIPLFWLGLGSNLLVRAGGWPGIVIATAKSLNNFQWLDNRTLHVEAGVSCAKVARLCVRHQLSGVEFLAGIPGTIGGALATNAGAWGGETWSAVVQVETLNRQGQQHCRYPADYEIGYRQVRGPQHEWFVAATLRLTPVTHHDGSANIRHLLKKREETQPIGLPSSGSVFRNPPGDYAGRIIESMGWKGCCVGGACVSEKHANFIINRNAATAADIETLIERIKQSVKHHYKIDLLPEVHIIGQP
jgi:UDP-N-acetylmuramate dehydrogenase